MIDCHCHILPGLDDGAGTLAEAVEIAHILADAGFSEVCCTPHMIKGAFDNGDAERLNEAVLTLQEEIDRLSIPLRLRPGLEYYMDEFLPSLLDEPLTFAGSKLLMIEAPSRATATVMKEAIYAVVRRGYVPLLAHVERYDFIGMADDCGKSAEEGGKGLWSGLYSRFVSDRRKAAAGLYGGHATATNIEELRDMGCVFQGNIGSFTGIYGQRVKERAIRYLESGLYGHLGSDAHRPGGLAEWLQRGLQTIRDIVGDEGLNALTGRDDFGSDVAAQETEKMLARM